MSTGEWWRRGGAPGDQPPPAETGEAGDQERGEQHEERQPFYCPACGRQYGYPRECSGTAQAPHQPTEVVSTDELSGDPEHHTPAPASE